MGYVETWPLVAERWVVREGDADGYGDSAESVGGPMDSKPGPASGDAAESSPHLDDLTELDGLEEGELLTELGNRIIRMSAHVAAFEYRLLVLIAEFDRRRGWERGGHRDCAAWLEMTTGMNRVTARERVRMARALVDLPRISEQMGRGELSYSKVRALVRVATPENEGELIPMARECTASRLEQEVAHFRELERWGDLGAEERRHRKRHLKVGAGADGMVRIRGELPAEVGALLMKVLDAAGDALFQGDLEWSADGGTWGPAVDEVTPDQRRADALHLVLDRAMASGFGGVVPSGSEGDSAESRADQERGGGSTPESSSTPEDRRADHGRVTPGAASAPTDSAESPCGCTPRSPSAERYTVMVHVDHDALVHKPGRVDLDGRMPIQPETARRLACDASVVRIVHGPESEILDVGRKTRVVPPAIRRALWARDECCRFPGCMARHVDAHHIRHWTDGGTTALDNLVLLCSAHHRGVHEGGFSIRMDRAGIPRFLNRDGVRIPDQPPAPELAPHDPVGTLVRTHRFRGIDPGPGAGLSWPTVPTHIENDFRAALDPP